MEALPYTSSSFNKASDIHDVYETYVQQNLDYFVCTTIRDLFVAHNVCDILGLSLLHNHFWLKDAEKLVHVENIASPWNEQTARRELLDFVVPTQWRFTAEGITPFEFTYSKDNKIISSFDLRAHEDFLKELQAFLRLQDLLDIFGIQFLDATVSAHDADSIPVEITRERCNITLPFTVDNGDENGNFEVLWRFDPMVKLKKCCVGKCLDQQSGHPKSHTHKTC